MQDDDGHASYGAEGYDAAVGSESVWGERAGAEPGGGAREAVDARASFGVERKNPTRGEPSSLGGGIWS